MAHPNFLTGSPCNCSWGRADLTHPSKLGGKLFDEIRQRKKLQTPEAQRLLRYLDQSGYVNDYTEKWIPWLLNRVKKGDIYYDPEIHSPLRYRFTDPDNPQDPRSAPLHHHLFQHWADWLNSGHGTRRNAGNPDNLSPQQVQELVDQWNIDLANREKEKVRETGTPIHTWPDGWTIRELEPHEVEHEGNAMGHCVGSYAPAIQRGHMKVLSLRDPKGDPHVTTGIETMPGDRPVLYQHYGKNNGNPLPEYNQRFAEYFGQMPIDDRPLAEDPVEDYIYDHDDLREYHRKQTEKQPEDSEPKVNEINLPYGNYEGSPDFDPDELHEELVHRTNHNAWFDPDRAERLLWLIKTHGYIPRYGNMLSDRRNDFLEDSYDNFIQHGPPWSKAHGEVFPGYHPEFNWEEPEWQEWLQKHNLEDTPENRHAVVQDYEDSEAEAHNDWLDESPTWQAIRYMEDGLADHRSPVTGEYSQQPYQPPQQQITAGTYHWHPVFHQPCLCPWGGGERNQEFVGSVKTADKAEWLRNRKDMQDDAAQAFLTTIEEYPDKLKPWIVREWRKGRIQPHSTGVVTMNKGLWPNGVERWELFGSGQAQKWLELADEMKKHRQGIDFMQHTAPELHTRMEQARDFLMEKKRPGLGEVIHRWPDGWTVRRLQNAEEARIEGNDMGHCVGSYGGGIDQGYYNILSLRDPSNKPHGTLELDTGVWDPEDHSKGLQDAGVSQWYGKSNEAPKEEYTQRMKEALDPHGVTWGDWDDPEDQFEPWWDDSYTMEEPLDYEQYNSYANDPSEWTPDEYWNACADAEEHGVDAPDLHSPDIDYFKILEDAIEHRNNLQQTTPDLLKSFTENMHEMGDTRSFHDAFKDYWRQKDQWEEHRPHPENLEYFRNFFAQHTNPETGLGEEPRYNHQTGQWETAMDRWWHTQQHNYPTIPGEDWEEYGPGQIPEFARPTVFAKMASELAPLYYRWALSPDTGEIEISHNQEGHPAEVDYHKGLAQRLNRPNLVHGYAYRIPGGYRITDWEHRPVDDPFVIAQVTRKLTGAQDESQWEDDNPDFSRSHYGLPLGP